MGDSERDALNKIPLIGSVCIRRVKERARMALGRVKEALARKRGREMHSSQSNRIILK